MTKAGQIAWWSIIPGVTIVAATTVAIIGTTVESNAIVRYAGLALQLLGLIEIIWSINDVNPLAKWARHFQERLSGWFRKPQVASAGATATLMVDARLDGTVHSSVPKPPTLEGVVRALERNVELLHARIREESVRLERQMDDRIAEVGGLVRDLRRHVDQHKAEIHVQLVHQARITWRSTAWLLIGVVASTIPDEIVSLARWGVF